MVSVWGFGRYDSPMKHLLVIGTIHGAIELVGDNFLVTGAGTLVYPSGYTFLLRSPAYMPYAWSLLVVIMEFLGIRLADTMGETAGYLGSTVAAFIAESSFESLASRGAVDVYHRSTHMDWRYILVHRDRGDSHGSHRSTTG